MWEESVRMQHEYVRPVSMWVLCAPYHCAVYPAIAAAVFCCLLMSQGSCAVGQTPKLPLVANAANTQIRDGPSGF